MHRRVKWIGIVVVLSMLVFAFRKPAENYFEIAKSLDIFATLFKEVNTYYVDEVEPKKLIRQGIDGMLESLDPYTDFIAEEEFESFRITTTGQYAGIGALIGVVNKKTVITHPYKNYPAYKAGIRVGDEIVAVNGINVLGKPPSEVSTLLKGQAKTDVEITVRRYGQKNDLVIKVRREKISLSNIAYAGMVGKDIGYIKLDDFTPGASKEVASAVVALKEKGATKLILDLRENPGGLLLEAVNTVNLFIPKGMEVVSTKGKVSDWNKTYTTLNNPLDTQIQLAILTSEGSASASEILAGALQDYDRAVLIGNRTFGKGLVQTTRPLSYNAQLKVTTAKYYIPSGRCIQKLDYTHRKQDGTVDAVADSLRKEFGTRNGRRVFDGGGLEPDVEVEQRYLGTIAGNLYVSGYIFDYASKYCAENAPPADYKSFSLPDKEYEKFVAWIGQQKFAYSTPLETEVKELKEAAKQERFYNQIEPDLNLLSKKIQENKEQDLLRFKDEIRQLLTRQIAFHYALHDAQIVVALNDDQVVSKAIEVLSNPVEYNRILSPR